MEDRLILVADAATVGDRRASLAPKPKQPQRTGWLGSAESMSGPISAPAVVAVIGAIAAPMPEAA